MGIKKKYEKENKNLADIEIKPLTTSELITPSVSVQNEVS